MSNTVSAPYKTFNGLKRSHRKRLIRTSILVANVIVLVAVLTFVLKSAPSAGEAAHQNAAAAANLETATNALDQLSSADIAVNVARATQMPEAASVTNQADSVNAQLNVSPADNTVIAKPQVVATALKSRKDIQKYKVQTGDTVSNLAAKFGITSDSIRWSNGMTGDSLTVGNEILVPPVSGIVYKVKAGDTPDSVASKYHANKDQLIAFNDAEVSGLPVGQNIVIPDGSVAAVRPTSSGLASFGGFAWGGSAIYGSNGYDYGYCTWYAANRRNELGRPVPSNLGNAYSWYRIAQTAGLSTGLLPQVGAVAVNEGGNHVSVVEQVNSDGSFWVSEMNSRGQVSITDSTPAGGWGRRDYKFFGSPGNLKFIY